MNVSKLRVPTMLALGAATIGMSLSALPARASTVTLYTFNSGSPTSIYYDGVNNFNVGNEFTVGANALSVTAIGAFVETSTGSTQDYISSGVTTVPFTAYIYSTKSGSTALDTVVIPVGTAVNSSGFAYESLTTTLSANTTYLLTDAFTGSGTTHGTPFADGAAAGTFNGATFVENVYSTSPTGYPSANNGGFKEFLGANLQYTAVPAPATASLLGAGALGLLLLRKRGRGSV